MTKDVHPTQGEYDDLIYRLEETLDRLNNRLLTVKDPNGTLAMYLRSRIRIVGQELVTVRRKRVSRYGPIKTTKNRNAKVPHRVNNDTKAASQSADKLAARRLSNKRGSSKKH